MLGVIASIGSGLIALIAKQSEKIAGILAASDKSASVDVTSNLSTTVEAGSGILVNIIAISNKLASAENSRNLVLSVIQGIFILILQFFDTVTIRDTKSFDINKGITDKITVLDITIVETTNLGTIKNVSEPIALVDVPSTVTSFNRTTTEPIALADIGKITIFSYSNPDYFSEDYVGIFTTF